MAETPSAPPPAPPPRRRRSLAFRLVRGGALLAALVVVVVMLVPFVLSMDWARRRLEAGLASAVDGTVRIAGLHTSWWSGFRLEGLEIQEHTPSGPRELLRVREAEADMAFGQLVFGRVSFHARVAGVHARVVVDGSESSNLERVFRLPRGRPARSPQPERGSIGFEGRGSLRAMRFLVEVEDATIEVHDRERGHLQTLASMALRAGKERDTDGIGLRLAADLIAPGEPPATPGRLEVDGTVDATLGEPFTGRLRADGLELAGLLPLLRTLAPGLGITTLQGRTAGELRIAVGDGGLGCTTAGEITVHDPRVAGPALGTLELRAPLFRCVPKVTLAREPGGAQVDLEGFVLDLGGIRLQGVPRIPARTFLGGRRGIALDLDADLALLAALPNSPLAALAAPAGRIQGRLGVGFPERVEWLRDADRILRALRGELALDVPVARPGGQEITGLRGTLAIADGSARFTSSEGTRVNGGPARIVATSALDIATRFPTEVEIEWHNGAVQGDAAPMLSRFVPLLAGLDASQQSRFRSQVQATARASGPAWPERTDPLGYLAAWSGKADLALLEGMLQPAPALQALLDFLGRDKPIHFSRIGGEFEVQKGQVRSQLTRFATRDRVLTLRGSVGVDGRIDYRLDLTPLLEGHRDGERIAALLGGRPLEATLGGTITAPTLALPDLGKTLVEGVLKGAAQDPQKAVEGLLDILRRRKKDK